MVAVSQRYWVLWEPLRLFDAIGENTEKIPLDYSNRESYLKTITIEVVVVVVVIVVVCYKSY